MDKLLSVRYGLITIQRAGHTAMTSVNANVQFLQTHSLKCKSPEKRGWRCCKQEGGSARGGIPWGRCCPTRRNVFCLAPGIRSQSLKPSYPQAWEPGCHQPSPGRPGFSSAVDERWRSQRRVYCPEGPLAPGRAVCRRSGKCCGKGRAGCWLDFVRSQDSFWSAWWSWQWPCAWMPRSAEHRLKLQAAGPRAQIDRRLESYHLGRRRQRKRVRKCVQDRQSGHWLIPLLLFIEVDVLVYFPIRYAHCWLS